jgi:nitrogen-specific signal transduction histidine kinase
MKKGRRQRKDTVPIRNSESFVVEQERGGSGGTGMGLTVAQNILRAHHADFSLKDHAREGLFQLSFPSLSERR